MNLKAWAWWLILTAIVAVVIGLTFGYGWGLGSAIVGIAVGVGLGLTVPVDTKAAFARRLNNRIATTATMPVGGWLRHHWLLAFALLACAAMAIVDWRVGLSIALIVVLLKFLFARSGLRKGLVAAVVIVGGIITAIEFREHVKSGVGTGLDTAAVPYEDTKKAVGDFANSISLPDVPLPRTKETIRGIAKEEATKIVDAKLGGTTPPAPSTPPGGGTPPPTTPPVPLTNPVVEHYRNVAAQLGIDQVALQRLKPHGRLLKSAGKVQDQTGRAGAEKKFPNYLIFVAHYVYEGKEVPNDYVPTPGHISVWFHVCSVAFHRPNGYPFDGAYPLGTVDLDIEGELKTLNLDPNDGKWDAAKKVFQDLLAGVK